MTFFKNYLGGFKFVAAVLGRLFSIIDPDPVTSLIRQFSSQSPNQTVETKNKERNSESAYDPILLSIEYAEQYLAAALNSIRTQASELNVNRKENKLRIAKIFDFFSLFIY